MTTILLQIGDEKRRSSLAETLREEEFNVIDDSSSSSDVIADAVLTDRPIDARSSAMRGSDSARDQVAVGAIGWEGSADVVLPSDVTDRELKLICSLLSEITHLRRESFHRNHERTEMQQLAFSDPLTSVPNRRAWEQEASRQFEHATAAGRPFALAIIDLDHFKDVNVHYGFAEGDEVLRTASRAISASVRASDFLARFGGDEFGLLLPEAAPSALASVVERVRRSVATHCSRPAGPNVSASVGYAMRQDETKFSQLFNRCDQALRQAKAAGRDRAVGG